MDLYQQWSDVGPLQLVEDTPLHSGPSEVASPHTSAHLLGHCNSHIARSSARVKNGLRFVMLSKANGTKVWWYGLYGQKKSVDHQPCLQNFQQLGRRKRHGGNFGCQCCDDY